jgi:4-amino-4-deoxy-L-arabinose transferase-like glycosyltransferase
VSLARERAAPRGSPDRGLRRVTLVVFAAGLLVSLAAVSVTGVRAGGDTPRYTRAAERILAGELPRENKAQAYLGFAVVLAAVVAVTGRAEAVVALNTVAFGLTTLAVFALGHRLFGQPAALLGAGLLLINLELAFWSAYLLPETLYSALLALAVWSTCVAGGRRGAAYGWAAVALLSTAFVRPNGWVMLPVAATYWLGRRRAIWSALGLGACLAAAAVVPVFREAIQAEAPEQNLLRGTVIWGSDAWRVAMPPPERPPVDWLDGIAYVLAHPVASVRLFLTRIGVEVLHARPFYSTAHNLIVVLFYLPLYGLAVAGYRSSSRRSEVRLLAAAVLAHLAVVGLTFADWDGRFLLHVVPLVTVLAGGGAAALAHRLAAVARPTR